MKLSRDDLLICVLFVVALTGLAGWVGLVVGIVGAGFYAAVVMWGTGLMQALADIEARLDEPSAPEPAAAETVRDVGDSALMRERLDAEMKRRRRR